MKNKLIFFAVVTLLIFGAQDIFAADYDKDFEEELNRRNFNLGNIEKLLQRRARQMDLAYCMWTTIVSPVPEPDGIAPNFNKSNCLDVLKLLVRYGANVNSQVVVRGNGFAYPLENALRFNHPIAVIQFLLDSGADPNRGDRAYPIQNAYIYGDEAVVNLLLDRGARGDTILLPAGAKGDNQMIQQLISRGVQIRSDWGAAALRNAAFNGKIDTVKLLVQNGVNVNARDEGGNTALMYAYDKGEAVDFEPRQAAAQPAPAYSAPAPVASAPAQQSAVPSAPTLQTGRYAWSNSGKNMTMRLSSPGIVQVTYNNLTAWSGTYRINGNQIVITATLALADYASLQGQTFSYTITSSTSFSGSGETWVRTGN